MHRSPSHTHDHRHGPDIHARHGAASLNRTAVMATLHCLSGCAIGEVTGMALGTALGWSNGITVAVAIVLAFLSGYAMTMLSLVRAGQSFATASRIALASDTASIAIMEIVDNAVMMGIPGAMDAGLDSLLFWGSLAVSLAIAGAAAFPLNRWLISKGQGHALAHAHH